MNTNALKHICNGIGESKSVNSIAIIDNDIDAKDFKCIYDNLKLNKHIEKLDLSNYK